MVNNKGNITIKNVSVGYIKNNQHVSVLGNINLQFNAGDFVGIVGLNGSGKSTLLRSICGLQEVLQGSVEINGRDINSISNNELAKSISVVLTEKISGFNLTAYDAVAAGQLPYTNIFNKLESANYQIIDGAIKQCGIEAHKHKLLTELSDGLFQKTMIAKSIAQQTPVMLLDEPTAFLDYASKHELFSLLKNLTSHNNKCILVSSHDLDLVLKYCNKVLIVAGNSCELCPTEEARGNTLFKELSGGFI